MYIINFIRGFCMALADSVPGVSGGTIAFILGFYDKFIGSLQDLMSVKSSKEDKKQAILFLLKIGIGWAIGFILAALFISSVFEKHIYNISSLFVGFIIFAIPIILKEEKDSLKGKYQYFLFALIGIVVVVLITYINPADSKESASLAFGDIGITKYLYLFVVGMIAISAMVLPGISGSTLLLIFGVYGPIMDAIKEVLHFNLEYVPALTALALGIVAGIAFVIKIINYSLKNFRSQTIYLVLGLMIGSLYSIFMGPTSMDKDPMTFSSFSILFFIIGGVIIIGLDKLKSILEKK